MRSLSAIVVALQMAIADPVMAARQAPATPSAQSPALAGRVLHADLPLPGATITARQGDRSIATSSDETGNFQFGSLAPGVWTLRIEMRGFATVTREVTIPSGEPELGIVLAMKRYEEIVGPDAATSLWPEAAMTSTGAPNQVQSLDLPLQAEILTGSITNGAATIFAQPQGMGNNRPRPPAMYSGAFTAALGNSAWNARPYSFGGSASPAPDYADAQLGMTFAGPLRIPGLLRDGPMTRVNYQHGVLHTATTQAALVPTPAERAGNLTDRPGVIRDPLTQLPFAGNVIPPERIAPQAAALLDYYPHPTAAIRTGANYERPVVGKTTTDIVQVEAHHNVSSRTQIGGRFGYQRTRGASVNLFDFRDTTRQSIVSAELTWTRRFSTRLQLRANYQLASSSSESTPFFANRVNVSGEAGITGNDQDPLNWGPPTIQFPDVADLSSASYEESSRVSHSGGVQASLRRGRHNMTFGVDVRLNGLDLRTQPDPRGTLTFTGAATGDAFADFLLGLPTTSAIASGHARARLHGAIYDAYFSDDFRAAPGLTFDLGIRWEYESPYRERENQLANLDVAPGFRAVAPVVGSSATGSLTGITYPSSLVRRDPLGFEPRLGVSWRPLLGSSLVIKGGYGLYRNLGVYQSIGTLLAQQPPFSNTFSVQSGAEASLTLAYPFPSTIPNRATFAVDPDFRTALLHSWQVTVQREFPASLTMVIGYFGAHGSRLAQAFLPNTYAPGALNPCVSCPSGFIYLASKGTSARNAGQVIVRRRLYAGFTAGVTYTLAKATDNASTFSNTSVSPGSLSVAQNWLDLDGERGPSSFDQRHVVQIEAQYTTGVGLRGGTLVDGWLGRLYKDWTMTATLNAGSGLPLTPVYFAAVPGSGVVGVRPALTGVPIAPAEKGSYANPAAFTAPAPGTWGNAGRNSIRGPSTFSFDVTLARAFRLNHRMTLEWRVAATNVLNRVTFSTVDRIITSPQFGRPTSANQMRRIQSFLSLKF